MLAVFDRDNNGYITRNELRMAMLDLGERLNDKQLQDMMDAADVNGDGVIDYKGAHVTMTCFCAGTCMYMYLNVCRCM